MSWKKNQSIKNDAAYLDPRVSALEKIRLTPIENTVTLSSDQSRVEIGIPAYGKGKEVLMVFVNSTYATKGVDYDLGTDAISIEKTSGSWAAGTELHFLILKYVTTDPITFTDADQIADGSIPETKFVTGLQTLLDQLRIIDGTLRIKDGAPAGSEKVVNIILGYYLNDIYQDVRGSLISGGGGIGYENIIGGSTANVGTTTPNVADQSGTGAHYAAILAGYDNVNNALAGIIAGYHCFIEKAATHGTISGGSYHKIIDGDYSTISGGTKNEINITDGGGYGSIGGGIENKITGKYGTVAGGYQNESSGERSSVGGGNGNKSQAYGSTVSGGSLNVASGNYSNVQGGTNNQATESGASVAGGRNNLASGIDAHVAGGDGNTAASDYSYAFGKGAKTQIKGQEAMGAGNFSVKGDAQGSRFIMRRQTIDELNQVIGQDGGTISPVLPDGAAWNFKYMVIAKTASGEAKSWEVKGMIINQSGSDALIIGTPTKTVIAETAAATTWDVSVHAGTDTLNIDAIGSAATTINWVAKLETVEVII